MKEKILEILQDLRPELDFTESNDFIGDGYLDSFDMIGLVSALDKEFGISILGEDIIPENFANIESIINVVNKYISK